MFLSYDIWYIWVFPSKLYATSMCSILILRELLNLDIVITIFQIPKGVIIAINWQFHPPYHHTISTPFPSTTIWLSKKCEICLPYDVTIKYLLLLYRWFLFQGATHCTKDGRPYCELYWEFQPLLSGFNWIIFYRFAEWKLELFQGA